MAPSPAGRWTARPTACRSPSASSASGTTRRSSSRPASPSPPTTWDEFNEAVDKLKAAGIEPVSVGAGDKWPAAHYWYYFALRECSQDVLTDAVQTLDFSDPCFVKAGEDLEASSAPSRSTRASSPRRPRQGATSAAGLLATGKVAMEMQGHWEPGVMQGLTEDGKGSARTPAGSRSRPSTAARATRRPHSVAATAGPSRRRRPTPRWTSLKYTASPTRSRRASRRLDMGSADQLNGLAVRLRTRPWPSSSRSVTRRRTCSSTSTRRSVPPSVAP